MLASERASLLSVFAGFGENDIGCSDAGVQIGL